MFARKSRKPVISQTVRSALSLSTGPIIEGLESRRMLSATLSTHGLLTVQCTGHADTVAITMDPQDSTELDVTLNGKTKQFFAANVGAIKVNGAGGNDTLSVDPSVTSPTSVNGGAGNDSLTAGSGNDTLNGGPGNDSLTGGTGNDSLIGAAGNDTITCGSGADQVNGGVGHDSVQFTPTSGVPLDTLPTTVQAGLTTLAQGATIGTVQVFQDNNQTYYGTEVTISGAQTRIAVDSAGNPVGSPPPAKGKGGPVQGPGSTQGGPQQDDGIFGSVVSLDSTANTITILASNPWGPAKQTTFKLTSSSTISADSATVTLAQLTAGTLVCVHTSSTDATTATSITAIDRRVGGTVSAISTDTIAITGPNGTSTTYSISSTATVTLNGVAGTLASVVAGANVQLTLSALGGIVISIQSNPQVNPGEPGGPGMPMPPAGIGGAVVSVNTTADTITIQNGDAIQTTYTLASAATVTLDGAASMLSSLVAGDRVELTLTTGATTVASIEASDQTMPPPVNNPGNPGAPNQPTGVFGLVVSVNTTADTITIQAADAASSTTYTLSSTAAVHLDGNASTLGALIAGDTAGLQFAADGVTVTNINASDQGQPTGPGGPVMPGQPGTPGGNPGDNDSPYGVVVSTDTTADTITLEDESGTSTTYTLSSTATISLDGAASTLSAVVAGDHAKLELSSDGLSVTSIQATDQTPPPNPTSPPPTPGQNPPPGGQVVSTDTTGDTITLKDQAGTTTLYTLTSTTTVMLDGAASTLSALVAGDHAMLQLSSDGSTVTSITATDQAPPPANPNPNGPPPQGGGM